MADKKYLVIIKGEDKTDLIDSLQFCGEKCAITYKSSPDKVYRYSRDNVEVHQLRRIIDLDKTIVMVKGERVDGANKIFDFGEYYKIICGGRKKQTVCVSDVQLKEDCLSNARNRGIFQYFKETAEAVSMLGENGINYLKLQYDKIQKLSEDTVLASYIDPEKTVYARKMPRTVIYPFGLNQSQKIAVERALSSKVSIIQGPPGTGKTQTILNIIANAVLRGKTVAVVSNNNSATHNVAEKMEKKNIAFITAFLGSRANIQRFLETQSGTYPDMTVWKINEDEHARLERKTTELTEELDSMLYAKNRVAEIDMELLQLRPEQHYFEEYYSALEHNLTEKLDRLSSDKLISLWMEFEQYAERKSKPGILKKILIVLKFGPAALRLFGYAPEVVIPYIQNYFYAAKKRELRDEKEELLSKLENYAFDIKLEELTQCSLDLLKAALAERYCGGIARRRFEKNDLAAAPDEFTKEYPVILSTTHSIKGVLAKDYIYDYLIVDEASQVDLATGVLALSCAKNVVIVGDLKQLPNVMTEEDVRKSEDIWRKYSIEERYRFSTHSLLSSAEETWIKAPVTLLREHYRCHPKIINFCNQKFYQGQLIIMTEDGNEPDVLTMYRTNTGNHARGHINQRQIDVIRREVLPKIEQKGYRSIGIIAPYRAQALAIGRQLGDDYEVDTVHKFQGREQDAVILTSVDNVITDFVDDAHMLNVAVSRAVHSLTVVTSADPRNDHTNYGDLARYIEYNNFEVIQSQVYSVFDMLYKGYAEQRKEYLMKHKRVSEFDSENLMHSMIQEILSEEEFVSIGCAVHVSLATLVRNYEYLTDDEARYARNPLTHVDFLLFNKMDKQPVLVIEVDGTAYHKEGSVQAERDAKKDRIMKICKLSMLRLRTDGSGEREKIESALRQVQR